MTLTFVAQTSMRRRRRKTRSHLVPVLVGATLAFGAVMLIGYLLWPTWQSARAGDPDRIPVSVGGTLFNVDSHAFRRKVQKHSGPQERVDLSYLYPSLQATDVPRHVSVEAFEEAPQPIDRIFLSISAHHDVMSPEVRLRTIYPRYSDQVMAPQDGLTTRPFRDATPYSNEDLFIGDGSALVARCTRDGKTPGMCLSERRIDGADLSFRFPRAWLAQWREVGEAMDTLTKQLAGPRG